MFASAFKRAASALSASDTSFNVVLAMIGDGTEEGGVSIGEAGADEEDAESLIL